MTELELKHWARSCLGKRRFALQRQAEKSAVRRGRRAHVELSTYYCSYCCGYHLFTKRPEQLATA